MSRTEERAMLDAMADDAMDADELNAFTVDVNGFEGPLHMLLALARRQKVDLRYVSILELAQQYLIFIEDAKDKRIDLAADYLLMAAWLAYLKSKLLLPKPEKADAGEVDADDMARRLAFRLQRLEAMREAVEDLYDQPRLGWNVFVRGAPEQAKVVKRTQYHARLIDMMAAFADIQRRKAKDRPHTVEKQLVLPLEKARISLKNATRDTFDWQQIDQIKVTIEDQDEAAPPHSRRASVFAAALELAKEGDVLLRQDAQFAPIFLKRVPETADGSVAA